MSNQEFGHLVRHAFKESKNMNPVGAGKNAFVAFFAGFLFGPIGVGIYLGSFVDFILSLGMVIAGSIMTAGIGAPVFWALCGAWAAARVRNSNA
ncbi:MAG: hypothetical protein ACREJD_08455 [Phycisphaerales bacterium]